MGGGGLDVRSRGEAGEGDACAAVVHGVRPAADLTPVLFYRASVFVREWDAVGLCARTRLEEK